MISIDNLERFYEHGATKTWVLRRAKIDLEEGELEIGQVCARLRDIRPAGEIVRSVMQEFEEARLKFATIVLAP